MGLIHYKAISNYILCLCLLVTFFINRCLFLVVTFLYVYLWAMTHQKVLIFSLFLLSSYGPTYNSHIFVKGPTMMHYLPSILWAKCGIKEGTPMHRPHHLHLIGTTISLQGRLYHPRSWADHRILFNSISERWNTLVVHSWVGQ